MKKDTVVSFSINIFLALLLFVLSYLLAMPVGQFITPSLYGISTGGGFLPDDLGDFLNGMPFIYVFLCTFLFHLFGRGRKWIWIIICAIPMIYFLFIIESDFFIWFWSVVFFAIGIIFGLAIHFLIKKSREELSVLKT